MKYNRQIQMVMKQQLGFSLNRYILKNNIDIKNLAVYFDLVDEKCTLASVCRSDRLRVL
ncbi:MAG: hypothetical protein IJ019_03930 [Alphaproteobacteria bacterium]|nr:hypothetical protein [Alphaproteobacteria bacterium]